MKNLTNISIVLSFMGLWISSIVPKNFEIIFGFALIFSFGILHGSNDLLIINKLPIKNKIGRFLRILLTYLLIIALGVILFYLLPEVALLLFIIFSAYHFGEQHWESKEIYLKGFFNYMLYFIYGLFILFSLFIFNMSDVIKVISSISNHIITNSILINCFIIISILLTILLLKIGIKNKENGKIILRELFYFLILGIIFKSSSLIWGFTIYFIFWHSMPSIYEQVVFIYGNSSKKHYLDYFKKAFPYWIVSLIGIIIVYFIFRQKQIFYAIFFSFIAAITFPHTIVINKMFKQKKRHHF